MMFKTTGPQSEAQSSKLGKTAQIIESQHMTKDPIVRTHDKEQPERKLGLKGEEATVLDQNMHKFNIILEKITNQSFAAQQMEEQLPGAAQTTTDSSQNVGRFKQNSQPQMTEFQQQQQKFIEEAAPTQQQVFPKRQKLLSIGQAVVNRIRWLGMMQKFLEKKTQVYRNQMIVMTGPQITNDVLKMFNYFKNNNGGQVRMEISAAAKDEEPAQGNDQQSTANSEISVFKNIQRRVYDTINVLIALGVINKTNGEITYNYMNHYFREQDPKLFKEIKKQMRYQLRNQDQTFKSTIGALHDDDADDSSSLSDTDHERSERFARIQSLQTKVQEISAGVSDLTLKNQQKYDYLVEQIKYVRNVEILKNRNVIENLQGSFPEDDIDAVHQSKFQPPFVVASFQRDASVEIIDRNGSIKIETLGQVGIMNDSEIISQMGHSSLSDQEVQAIFTPQIDISSLAEIQVGAKRKRNEEGSEDSSQKRMKRD